MAALEKLTPIQIHDLLWLGDSPTGRNEHPRHRALQTLLKRNMAIWKSGTWRLTQFGRLAIHGLTECPAVGKCIAKHTFDYSEREGPRMPLARELETLINVSQGLLDALENVPWADEREDNVIEVQEALGSAKVALSREEA